MIRLMSLLLMFFVFFMTTAMTLAENSEPLRTPTSPNKTSESNLKPVESSNANSRSKLEDKTKKMLEDNSNSIKIIRLSWKLVPYAVKYKVTFDNEEYMTYINGIEIPVNDVAKIFKITALDCDNNVIKEDVSISEAETNPLTMKTTTEFDKMDYAPLYPVYSWVPKHNADYYIIQLIKDDEVVRTYESAHKKVDNDEDHDDDDIYDFYDNVAVNEAGHYYWRVKAMTDFGFALSDWSEETDSVSFDVKAPTEYAAFGDSITHGGGAITVPPSVILYNWESYCDVPIKNLGKSGDTTNFMVKRFDHDVLPFLPKYLFIMGGVNDYRGNVIGWDTVCNYELIVEKCKEHGIVPIFITPTPVNPNLIKKFGFIEMPPVDWQTHYNYACDWIKRQEHFIDLTAEFENEKGYLREDLTTDGLHPDLEGKKIIGQAVNEWIINNE